MEQSTGELSFGAGYSTSEGVIGDVSITERNLLGRGQFLRLRLAGSLERLQIDLSFTEPRFLDRNLAAGFDLFHKIDDGIDVPAVQTRARPAARCASGSRWPRTCGSTNSYTLSNNEIVDVQVGRVARDQGGRRATYWTSLGRHQPVLRSAQPPEEPDQRLLPARRAPTSPASAATCSTSACSGRGPLLLSDHGEDHLRRPRHRRPHPGLGRPGRPPARPVLQGRRDHPRLRHVRLRSARHADGRRARRRHLLGGDGGGALPVPVRYRTTSA